jgi:hypothetical protein
MSHPSAWGPPLWKFIHTICNFEKNDEFSFKIRDHLKILEGVIPCEVCRTSYSEKIKELDTLDLTKPWALYNWTIDLHNHVNRKIGKPLWIERKKPSF